MNTNFKRYLVKVIKFYWVRIYLLDVCWWSEFPFFSTQIERRRNSYWRNVFRYCQMNLTWRAFRRRKKADSKKQENTFFIVTLIIEQLFLLYMWLYLSILSYKIL